MSDKIGFYGGETSENLSLEDMTRECMKILEVNVIPFICKNFNEPKGDLTMDIETFKQTYPDQGETTIVPPSRETVHFDEPEEVYSDKDLALRHNCIDLADHEPLYCIGDVVEFVDGGIGHVVDVMGDAEYIIDKIRGYKFPDRDEAYWCDDDIKGLLVISVRELCAIEHAKYMEDYSGENNE